MFNEALIPYIATGCFALAVLHTFCVHFFQEQAHKYSEGSVGENLFHLLGEVEVVFGLWAGLFILLFMMIAGHERPIAYLESRHFTEPMFVFVIMVLCAARPILAVSENLIQLSGRLLPLHKSLGFYAATLIVGPTLGSFITEPAAMTVTALILLKYFYNQKISEALKYATLGLLFVNISIGGTLTPYAAPPVLMVAPKWGWDLTFMLTHFGWKALVAMIVSTSIVAFRFRNEIKSLEFAQQEKQPTPPKPMPIWVMALHLLILLAIVLASHHMVLFMGLFLLFLGVATVTKEYQTPLKIRESLLVGFFLGGLVVLGGQQNWWLEPLLAKLTALPLYLGSITLTAFTDNAAITYLGSQVADMTDISKYALVAGSVVGGGLTVIANAPNPAGYSILNASFGEDGISPLALFLNALFPTLIAAACFWFL